MTKESEGIMDKTEAKRLLYRMLHFQGARVRYSDHSFERMAEKGRRFTMQDVITALSGGIMVDGPNDNGREGEFECVMRLQVENRTMQVPVVICEAKNLIVVKSTVRTKLKLRQKVHKK